MPGEAVFIPQDEAFVATELARGPWDPGAQHGGAPAALLMRAFERLPAGDELQIARVTYELLRPVPLGRREADADVTRRGRRVQLLEGSIRTPDGIEVVRARALQVHRADAGGQFTAAASLAPGPEQGRERDGEGGEVDGEDDGFNPPHRPMFAPDAIEIRFVDGVFGRGPSTAWFRLRVPLV